MVNKAINKNNKTQWKIKSTVKCIFYDAFILATTQQFDEQVFADALAATAAHRGTTEQIANIPEILGNVEESPELRTMWEKYRKQFAYAKDIKYGQIIEVLRVLIE